MALKHGSDHYTKWMHLENGQVLVRRIQRLEIQDALGRLHHVTGRHLPEAIVTSTSEPKKHKPTARILLRPRSSLLEEWRSLDSEPSTLVWNAFVFGLGFVSALGLRYFARLLVDF